MEETEVRESKVKDLLNGIVKVDIDSKETLFKFKEIVEKSGFNSFEVEGFLKDFEMIQSSSFINKEQSYVLFFGEKEFGIQTEDLTDVEERLLDLVNELENLSYLFCVITNRESKAVIVEMDGERFTRRELN